MRVIIIVAFVMCSFSIFSQERVNHTYKFSIQSITSYSQAKPYYDKIRIIFSESKSMNHVLMFDSNEGSFKVESTIYFDREKLMLELEKIGLVLRSLTIDGLQ
jgi:hypothetical protein